MFGYPVTIGHAFLFSCQCPALAFFGLLAIQGLARFFLFVSRPLSIVRRSRLFQPSMRYYQKVLIMSSVFEKKTQKNFISYYSKEKQAFLWPCMHPQRMRCKPFFLLFGVAYKIFFVPFLLILCRNFFKNFFDQKNFFSPPGNLWITRIILWKTSCG